MKKLSILILLIIASCDPDQEDRTTCYSYINNSNQDIVLEMYDYNSGQFITEIGTFSLQENGLIVERCKTERDVPGPTNLYRFDSIVVKFNNIKKLTYLFRLGQNPDPIFDGNEYDLEQVGNTFNLSWKLTEEDFNNAVFF